MVLRSYKLELQWKFEKRQQPPTARAKLRTSWRRLANECFDSYCSRAGKYKLTGKYGCFWRKSEIYVCIFQAIDDDCEIERRTHFIKVSLFRYFCKVWIIIFKRFIKCAMHCESVSTMTKTEILNKTRFYFVARRGTSAREEGPVTLYVWDVPNKLEEKIQFQGNKNIVFQQEWTNEISRVLSSSTNP